jgi:ABC-type amino acid transport substrate-binding protein
MRKLFYLLAAVLFSATAFAQKYTGDSWAKVKSTGSGTLTVVYYSQPGLIIKGPDGKLKGVCVDILNDFVKFVQEKHGKKITLNYAGEEPVFPDFLSTVKTTHNILGVTNVTITEERKKDLKFTPPFLTNPVIMISHKDAPTLTSLAELSKSFAGYTAEVISGSTHVRHMERIKKEDFPALKITYNTSGPLILEDIKNNPKLFTILDFTEYVDATRKQLPVKRQNVEISKPEELAFIMSLKTDWDGIWKEFMTDEYKTSVRYRKLIVDNLGANFLAVVR